MNLSKRVSVYLIVTLISKGVGFLLLPLYTKHLSPADYGVLAIIDMIGLYFGVFVSGGMNTALVRFYEKDNIKNNSAVFTAITLMVLGLFVVVYCLSLIASYFVKISEINTSYILIALIYIGFDTVNSVYIKQMVVDKNERMFFTIGMVRLFIAVPLNIYFIAYLEMGVTGFLYANAISSICIWLLFSLPYLLKNFVLEEKLFFKKIITYSLPFIPNGLLETLFSSISILMLTYFMDAEAVGLFAIAVKLASILLLTSSPIQNVWIPHMFSIKDEETKNKQYSDGFRLILIVLFSVSALLIAFSGVLFYFLIDAKFAESLVILPILLLANSIYMLRGTARIGLAISDDVKKIPIITLMSILISLPFYVVLTVNYGALGVAIGQLILSLVLVGMLLFYSNKHVKITINYMSIIMPIIALIFLPMYFEISVGFELYNPIGIITGFFILIYFSGALTKDDKLKLRSMLKRD